MNITPLQYIPNNNRGHSIKGMKPLKKNLKCVHNL